MRQLKITKSITNRESASLDKYLQEIGREDLITVEEEVELAQAIKRGDRRALEKLTRANLRFVVSVAKQYQNQGLSLPDLINEGNLGLIKAAEKFDETRGFKFISYAVWWIRQSILQAIAENARLIRLPLNKISTINKVNRCYTLLEQEFQREPTEEEIAEKMDMTPEVRNLVQIGMLGAVSVVLMMFEIPLFFAPSFYKIDLSEIPVLIGTFAMGPVAGMFIELIKVVLHMLFKGSSTAGVGDFANFLIGCAMIVPAGLIYQKKKSKKSAVIGMIAGTLFMAFIGCFLNAFVLLPAYGKAFGMPVDALVAMGTAVNPAINSLLTFVVLAVAPFNILKGLIVGVITFLLYKHVSPILHGTQF